MQHKRTALNLGSVNMAALWCEICSDVEGQVDPGRSVSPVPRSTLATLYCKNCRQSLCRTCGSRHTRQRFAADHKVVELARDSRRLDSTEDCDCSPSVCTQHSKDLVVYCRDCDELGCLSCLSLDAHRGHRWCDVELASQEARERLTHHLEEVNAKLEECRQATDRQRRCADALDQSLHHAYTQLRAELEKLHQDLDRCVEELECKLTAADGKKTQLENGCGELQEQTNTLSTFAERCRQVIESASAIELLRCSSELSTQAKRLINMEVENDLCSDLRVVFTPTNLRRYLPRSDVNLVGSVSVDDADFLSVDEDKLLHGIATQKEQKGEFYFAIRLLACILKG